MCSKLMKVMYGTRGRSVELAKEVLRDAQGTWPLLPQSVAGARPWLTCTLSLDATGPTPNKRRNNHLVAYRVLVRAITIISSDSGSISTEGTVAWYRSFPSMRATV